MNFVNVNYHVSATKGRKRRGRKLGYRSETTKVIYLNSH